MKETIERIQDWYKINCDGDWEHGHSLKIVTLDNPGWSITIYLEDTALEKLDFGKEFQNPNDENDWFFIKTEDKSLKIYCGPENMKFVLDIFLDEIIPNYSDEMITYELHVPLKGLGIDVWTPVKSRLVNERSVQITKLLPIKYNNIKVRDEEKINFHQAELDNCKLEVTIGDIVEVDLVNVFDGLIITPKIIKA